MSTPQLKVPVKNPIKGPGLKAPGVVLLQFLLILFFETIEYKFTKVGLFTGIAIVIAYVGGLKLGRSGTTFTSVVNPPLAFFISSLLIISTVGGVGFHVGRLGLDLMSTLSGVAPFLVSCAIVGWIYFFASEARAKRNARKNA